MKWQPLPVMKLKRKKSNLTLLEVLIAMTLVVFCALPLIYPHVAMYKEQVKEIEKIEDSDRINFWFSQFYEQALRGEVAFSDFVDEEPKAIEGIEGATYRFVEEKKKEGKSKSVYYFKAEVKKDNLTYYFPIIVTKNVKQDEENKETDNAN
jgi:hypothetical protein